MPVAEAHDLGAGKGLLLRPAIHQDKVIARAVHFGEFQNHPKQVTNRRGEFKDLINPLHPGAGIAQCTAWKLPVSWKRQPKTSLTARNRARPSMAPWKRRFGCPRTICSASKKPGDIGWAN